MQNYLLTILLVIFSLSVNTAFGQTQEEIERMLNGGQTKTETVVEKEKKVKEEKAPKVKKEKVEKVKAEKEPKVKAEKEAKVKVEKEPKVKAEKEKETKAKVVKEPKVKVEKEAKAKSTKEKTSKTKTAKEQPASADKQYMGSAKFLKAKADYLYKEGKYYKSSNYYLAALEKAKTKKLKSILNYKVAQSSFQVRDYQMAELYFTQSMVDAPKKLKNKDALYFLAQSHKYQGEYEEAKVVFKDFIKSADGNDKLSYEATKARLEIKGCDLALEMNLEDLAYVVKNPGEDVNGPFAEFGPEIRNNELIFSKITSENSKEDEPNHIAKLYSSSLYAEKYGYAQNFSSVLNEGAFYVCNTSFSQDGKNVYYAKCQFVKGVNQQCQIYKSTLKDGIWTAAVALNENINEKNSNATHPQIVINDAGIEKLYFTSDRSGGKGGRDIWSALKNEDGSFSKAQNLGGPINTKYDEISPFFDVNTNTLYFSTDGKPSIGGLDIYKSEKLDGEWSEPINMGIPVNSSVDDYDFVLDNKGELGFLVSNRVGTTSLRGATCCDDIFEVRSTKIELFLQSLVYAENEGSREVMKEGKLNLSNKTLGTTQNVAYEGKVIVLPLEKECDYELKAIQSDFEDVSLVFTTKGKVKSDTLHFDLFFKERKTFNNQMIGVIYYDYNQAMLTKEAPETLKKVMEFLNTYPTSIVEVSAHTDGNGPEDFNLSLSKERCEAAANYLVFNGIKKSRVSKLWFGETKPVASEINNDGTDNAEGRALNRRTEFKIVEQK